MSGNRPQNRLGALERQQGSISQHFGTAPYLALVDVQAADGDE
jgi:predicted Fe-Mo cluster-binding NifX family protein